MENQIGLDTSLFLYSILLGFSMGMCYEVTRLVRFCFPSFKALSFLLDLLFFLAATAVYLLFNFAFSDGIVRWFSVFGFWMGFYLYLGTVGKILSAVFRKILSLFLCIFRFLFRHTLSPLLNVIKKVTFTLFTKCRNRVIIIKTKVDLYRLQKQKNALIRKAEKGF